MGENIDRLYIVSHAGKRRIRSMKFRYLSKSILASCKGDGESFEYINFRGAHFSKSTFKNAFFKGCDFWGTTFKKCKFNNVVFQAISLRSFEHLTYFCECLCVLDHFATENADNLYQAVKSIFKRQKPIKSKHKKPDGGF